MLSLLWLSLRVEKLIFRGFQKRFGTGFVRSRLKHDMLVSSLDKLGSAIWNIVAFVKSCLSVMNRSQSMYVWFYAFRDLFVQMLFVIRAEIGLGPTCVWAKIKMRWRRIAYTHPNFAAWTRVLAFHIYFGSVVFLRVSWRGRKRNSRIHRVSD